MLTNGQQIGRYTIISALGAGGMGEVYLAENTKLDRIENSEHQGKAGDGQFLKRGTCVNV